jgi:hypothetical protein
MAGLVPRLPGSIFLYKAHGIDSNEFRGFGDSTGHRKGSTPCRNKIASFMAFSNSSPGRPSIGLWTSTGGDELVRKFTTRDQLISLLFGQFSGAASLREIEAAMASHRTRLYHLGAKEAVRSTLADANRCRSQQSPDFFRTVRTHARHGDARQTTNQSRFPDSSPPERDKSASQGLHIARSPLKTRRALPLPLTPPSGSRTCPARPPRRPADRSGFPGGASGRGR